jgi:hypothetical protein
MLLARRENRLRVVAFGVLATVLMLLALLGSLLIELGRQECSIGWNSPSTCTETRPLSESETLYHFVVLPCLVVLASTLPLRALGAKWWFSLVASTVSHILSIAMIIGVLRQGEAPGWAIGLAPVAMFVLSPLICATLILVATRQATEARLLAFLIAGSVAAWIAAVAPPVGQGYLAVASLSGWCIVPLLASVPDRSTIAARSTH